MGTTFPQEKFQLDLYEAILVELHITHDCHRLFSAKCAASLGMTGVKINWSLMSIANYNRVITGMEVKTCELCCSMTHTT